MRNQRQRSRLSCAALALGLALGSGFGCRSGLRIDAQVEGDAGAPQGPPIGLRIDGLPSGGGPLDRGASVQLRVLFEYSNGAESNAGSLAQLSSSAPLVASIDPQRVLHALSAGDAILAASVPGDAALQTQLAVRVQVPGSEQTVAVEVAPGSATLAPGLGLQLRANATQADHSQRTVTGLAAWSSSNPAVCTVDDGARKGFVTALQPGSCTLSATFQGFTGQCNAAVQSLTVTALAIAPAAPAVAKGGALQLTATATLSDGSAFDATGTAAWSSSAQAIATVSETGLASGLSAGSAALSATLRGKTAQVSLRVNAATLLAVSVAPGSLALPLGLFQGLRAIAVYSDGTTTDATGGVAWSSDLPAAVSVDQAGVVRALQKGRARISAALGGVQGLALVDATEATLTALSLLPAALSLPIGTSGRLRAIGTFSDHTLKEVSADATWSTQAPAIATVDANGLVSGLAKGSSQVAALLTGQTATASVDVTDAALAALVIAPVSVVLPVGATQRLFATGIYSDGTLHDATASATWSSDTAAVATLSNAAGSRGRVTAVGQGTGAATTSLGSVTSNASTLTVTGATLIGLRLAPQKLVVPVLLTLPLRLFARYSDGTEFDETAFAAFASDQPLTASVVASGAGAGLVTGVQPGAATVTGFLGGLTATSAVRIADAQVQSIQVIALRDTMTVGDAQQLRALATFSGRPRPVDVTALCAWTSADPQVAALGLSRPGLLVARAPGNVQVTAAFAGVTGSQAITVSPLLPTRIDVLEGVFTLPVGLTRTLIAKATYSDGSTADVTFGAAWSSDRPQLALVADAGAAKGLVTAVSAGVANIRAQLSGVTGSAQATIDVAHATSLTLSPADPVVTSPGGPFRPQTVRFSATAHFDDGHDYDVTRESAWFSSDPTVAAISNSPGSKGLADVVAVGGATIAVDHASLKANTFLTSR